MEVLSSNIVKKEKRPITILQVGEGNFLRGFFDYFIYVLNRDTDYNGDVAIVQPRNSHRIGRFFKQDCLYDVITEGLKNGKVVSYSDVVDIIGDAVDPYEDYEHFLSYAKSEDLKVFASNTTEHGIVYDETDTDLSVTPTSYPAKFLAFLKTRYDHFNGSYDAGLYIMPMELITMNGEQLKEILIKLAKLNNLGDDFLDWMLNANKFYSTLVDRIVPGFPRDDIDSWQEKWGYIDNLAVKGEAFHLFVIQGDKSILDVLPFDKTDLNVVVTDNVAPYKERKVKILNGAHTFLVSIAYQCGFRIVNKTMADKEMLDLLNSYLDKEVIGSIDLDRDDILKFKEGVYERFSNPTIQHEWTSIMLNSMSKYKERVLPVVVFNKGNSTYGLFSLASLLHLYKINSELNNELFSDSQEFLDMYSELFDGKHSSKEIVEHVLGLDFWEYEFSSEEKDYVLQCYDKIENEGIKEAVKWVKSL